MQHEQVGTLPNNTVVEVCAEVESGFYKLVDGRGYTMASGADFKWIPGEWRGRVEREGAVVC